MTIRTAELLSIGTELLVGETRDTNAGDLARDLTGRGVLVRRISALPDDLAAVRDAFAAALAGCDLVVSTGGLGPTPDDLTREAIAALLGETPEVDAGLEAWLRELFDRRRIPFPEANRKQAWLIPSAEAIPNGNGTAPGWLVSLPDGGTVVALPGPPREMTPMWHDWVVPRLEARGLGGSSAVATLRLTGIGESAVADRLGSLLDPGARPAVATYARADGVDVRISAVDDERGGRPAAALVADVEERIVALVGDHVWARGRTTWPEALAGALDRLGWRLAVGEVGLRGALVTLLGEGLGERLVTGEVHGVRPAEGGLTGLAAGLRRGSGADVALAAQARARGGDTAVSVAIDGPAGRRRETRIVFLGGAMGRTRAALAAAGILLTYLEDRPSIGRIRRARRGDRRPATVSRA